MTSLGPAHNQLPCFKTYLTNICCFFQQGNLVNIQFEQKYMRYIFFSRVFFIGFIALLWLLQVCNFSSNYRFCVRLFMVLHAIFVRFLYFKTLNK